MGMSSDFEQAILSGSTYLRLGTIIFGERNLLLIKIFVFLLINGSIFKKSFFDIAIHPCWFYFFIC